MARLWNERERKAMLQALKGVLYFVVLFFLLLLVPFILNFILNERSDLTGRGRTEVRDRNNTLQWTINRGEVRDSGNRLIYKVK